MRVTHLTRALITAALIFLSSTAFAQPQLSTVVSGLSSPVFVGNAGDGSNRLFIVEQPGVIKVLQPGASMPTVFLDIQTKVLPGGERGLLGLAFHPQYLTNGRLFVFYTRAGDGALVIAEYVASPANANTAGTTERILLTIAHPTYSNHNGGMLAFGPDTFLYIGVGDGGGANDPNNNAQNKNSLLGKILRIDVNAVPYAIPADNPFAGPIDGLDEVYAYGMRNPWRFSFDRATGIAWVGDVGQGAREEVDTPLVNGGNYGWPILEGTRCNLTNPCTPPENYVPPLFEYEHLGGRCSLTGGYVYRGSADTFATGTYIYGDYCSGEIFAWSGGPPAAVVLASGMNLSSFGEDEAGELYVVGLGGTISRLQRASTPSCTYSITPTRATFGPAEGTGTITVTAEAGCTWTATSNASWITITGATGSGNGTVTYSVTPYTAKPKKRNGSITVAGQNFTIQQSR